MTAIKAVSAAVSMNPVKEASGSTSPAKEARGLKIQPKEGKGSADKASRARATGPPRSASFPMARPFLGKVNSLKGSLTAYPKGTERLTKGSWQ